MLNFCTLFDSNYLAKGLCMYDSLKRQCSDFQLYIFAFDESSYRVLDGLRLINVTVISLKEFEDEKLLGVKLERTKAEYCWTSTPSTISYCIEHFQLDHCIYIDADLFFYSDPVILINELKENEDVLITEHRYTPEYDQTELSGKYCVQFVYFRNNTNGLSILNWWRNACLDWCYARREDGKFGDQKYLDDWPIRFQGVHELKHQGGGVAPWNIQQYSVLVKNQLLVRNTKTNQEYQMVFFHFHHMNILKNKWLYEFYLGDYYLSGEVLLKIYKPYIQCLKNKYNDLLKIDYSINSIGAADFKMNIIRLFAHFVKNMMRPNRINWIRLWHN